METTNKKKRSCISRIPVQSTSGKMSPNNGTMKTPNKDTEALNPHRKTNIMTEVSENTYVVEPKKYQSEEALVQNMAPPPVHNFNYPPPVRLTQNSETTVMLDCISQLQFTLQLYVLTNSKQAEYHMSQNADLFTEMIKVQNRRDLYPAVMAIPMFMGNELEKCLDWINRVRNICTQAGY